MPVIRISDSNYKRLQAHAVPLKDTPNDVLSRILDLAEDKAQLRFPDMPEIKTEDLLGLPPYIQDGKLVELVEDNDAVQS